MYNIMSDTVSEQVCEGGVILRKEPPKKGRNWCFTLNNYSESEILSLTQDEKNEYEYIFQEEVGENGTPHLQGLICFKNARSFESVKKLVSPRCHLEYCRNKNASIKYCSKEDTRKGKIYSNMQYVEEERPWCEKDMKDELEFICATDRSKQNLARLKKKYPKASKSLKLYINVYWDEK